jgi:hypothetical protein
MGWKPSAVVRAAAIVAALLGVAGLPAVAAAQENFAKLSVTLDRTQGAAAAKANPTIDISKLQDSGSVCIDFKVLLDGKSRFNVLTSEEGLDRRFNVDCRPGLYGRLPMGDGVEYFAQTVINSRKASFSAYPGVRTRDAFNDVSCVFDPATPNVAIFRLRGFFTVLRSELPDQTIVELRPVQGTAADAKACFGR